MADIDSSTVTVRDHITGAQLRLPLDRLGLHKSEQVLAERLLPLLQQAGNEASWVRDLALAVPAREESVRRVLNKLALRNEVYQVAKDLFLSAKSVAALVCLIHEIASAQGRTQGDESRLVGVQVREFCDASKISRRRGIQILEMFDRLGFTTRQGDLHIPGMPLVR